MNLKIGGGNVRRRYKSSILIAIILVVGFTFAIRSTIAASNPYKDVREGTIYHEAILELTSEGIMEGKSSNEFGLKQNATREETAYYIAKALKLDLTAIQDPGFTDVSKTSKYYPAIAKLNNLGIIQGVGNGKFSPKGNLERYQIAIMIVKAFELEKSSNVNVAFKDISKYSKSIQLEIQTLVDYGIATGKSKTAFAPKDPVTKGDLALFLKRSIDKYNEFDIILID